MTTRAPAPRGSGRPQGRGATPRTPAPRAQPARTPPKTPAKGQPKTPAKTPAKNATKKQTKAPGQRGAGPPGRGPTTGSGPVVGSGTVSATSAQRFAARVRRRRRHRLAMTAGLLTFVVGCGWLVFASPLLAVTRIEVRGTTRVPLASVQHTVADQVGRPMALVSSQVLARRVAALPLVLSVRVDRDWPGTVVITVSERLPIAAVPADGGGYWLVDGDGVTVQTVSRAPTDLPVLHVEVRTAGAGALRAARTVYDSLPAALRPQVRQIRAASPDAVSLALSDGTTVTWGSAQDSVRKAAVLMAVHPAALTRAVVIDVSAPGAPAVTAAKTARS